MLDINKIPLDDSKTYDLISSGQTVGCFQIESFLGAKYSKETKPHTIEEIADLISIIRPGTIEAEYEGKSLTKHYCDVKHGRSEPKYLHPALEKILGSTYSVLVYQESILSICKELAGFDLNQADQLRKSCAKKLPELMAKVKIEFMDGIKKTGIVSEEIGHQIFDWIEKSQRYLFNKCLAGWEKIYGYNQTIEELYNSKEYNTTLSMDQDGNLVENKIKNISFAGEQWFCRIILNGEPRRIVDCTINHKFPTDKGIKLCEYLKVGDNLYIQDETDNTKTRLEKIISIYWYCDGNAYDIEMEAPHHNFVTSNGIVTCNSHAVGYGKQSYQTAYLKAHYPLEFYCTWLQHAKDKQDPLKEIHKLVEDAQRSNIEILPPDIRRLNKDFIIGDDNKIYFGLSSIKNIGSRTISKLVELLESNVPETWVQFLLQCSDSLDKRTVENLIKVGALDFYGNTRNKMLFEYNQYNKLTKNEINKLNGYDAKSLIDVIDYLIDNCKINKRRIVALEDIKKILINPLSSLEDSAIDKAQFEFELLGISLTSYEIQEYDSLRANCTCRQFMEGKHVPSNIILAVNLDDIRLHKTKNGDEMAFLQVTDSHGDSANNIVVFSDVYQKNKFLLTHDRKLYILGFKNHQYNSMNVQNVIPMKIENYVEDFEFAAEDENLEF